MTKPSRACTMRVIEILGTPNIQLSYVDKGNSTHYVCAQIESFQNEIGPVIYLDETKNV